MDAAVARCDQRIVGDLDIVQLDVVGRGVERMLGFGHPRLCSLERGIGAIQLLPALVQEFLGLDALLHRVGGAVDFLFCQENLSILLGYVGISFVDGTLRLRT